MCVTVPICFVIILGLYLYHWVTQFNFWAERNVTGPEPNKIFGNFWEIIWGKTHESEFARMCYEKYTDVKMVGVFSLNTPVLILRDLDLIRDVLINDFSAFTDRGIHVFDTTEPQSQNLFNLPYQESRPLRLRMSAPFSGSKNEMLEAIQDVADETVDFIERTTADEDRVDCSNLFEKYAIEAIGNYCLALEMHQFSEEENEFKRVSEKRKELNLWNSIRKFAKECVPYLYRYFPILPRNKRIINYYATMLEDIEKYRNANNICKKDYVGRLLQLEIKKSLVAAQVYLVFTAGADSTSVVLSNGFYELAMNENIQERLRNDIHRTLKTKDKKLSYEDLKNMTYLDQVYKEILRKYPLRNITRMSNKTYKFYGTNVEIPAGVKIIIPIYGIHRDKQYYENPNTFDPERFADEQYRHPMTFLTFGGGPRYCMGKKLAENLIKIIIVKIILNFNVKINAEDAVRKENDPRKLFLWPKGGIHLRFERRTH